ncbi:MAG: pentapeptide repeat-containing protein [Terriglobales bacterium]
MAIFLAVLILWKVPQCQVSNLSGLDAKERFDRVNEARKTLAQIVGGIAVLAGFYSTVQSLKVAQQSFALAQEGQITDRFSKAIEQLGAVDSSGHKKLEVRLGGIYALQRIADESRKDHWPIMEVLTAYIRDNAPIKKQQQPKLSAHTELPLDIKPATDIQAILTVLATRNAKSDPENRRLNLSDTDIRGANLSGANLRRAHLFQAHLNGASLTWAHLNGAYLTGADLSAADLHEADLSGADLRWTDLRGADLSLADLKRASLNEANLSNADLTTARNLEQQQIDSAKGDINTKLPSNLRMPEPWKKQ